MVASLQVDVHRCRGEEDMAALRIAALPGLGIVLKPHIMVQDDLRAGRLVPVDLDLHPPVGRIHAVHLGQRHASDGPLFIRLVGRGLQSNFHLTAAVRKRSVTPLLGFYAGAHPPCAPPTRSITPP